MSAFGNPTLVLNADFRPLSYYPLSLCSWQNAIKSVFLERVFIIENYDQEVHSPTITFRLPSVIALKNYVMPNANQRSRVLMFFCVIILRANTVTIVFPQTN